MKVNKLTLASPAYLKKEIIQMNIEFQELLNEIPDEDKIKKGLNGILDENTAGHAFVLSTNEGDPAGMIYCNIGSGMQCGGLYLWINGIYVRNAFQKSGAGSFFLKEVLRWAKSKGCVYAIASRDLDNEASKMLFKKGGFAQEESVLMDRRLD